MQFAIGETKAFSDEEKRDDEYANSKDAFVQGSLA